MRVKALVSIVGLGFALDIGDERDFPDAEAVRLISAGAASPVMAHEVETAVVPPPRERRARRKGA